MTYRRREADSNLQFRVDGAVETGTDSAFAPDPPLEGG
jgi:hypothetical protein